jgi:hypothetical protein
LNFVILNNPQITNALNTLVGISEAIRLLLIKIISPQGKHMNYVEMFQKSGGVSISNRFNEWLASLIDGKKSPRRGLSNYPTTQGDGGFINYYGFKR